jgi:prephenate dehydrogenase
MQTETVSIIGLDRITASIGLGLQINDLGLTIIGSDQDASAKEGAKHLGAVTKLVGNPVSAAAAADILILNVSLAEQEQMIEAVANEVREHVLIIDLARLKSPGLKWADKYIQQGHYVGASPVLAAKSLLDGRFGVEAARDDLFKQSIFCIMPSAKADPKAVETAVNLGRILGATPFFLDPMEYDSLVQGVETTPGLLAAAMYRAVTKSTGWRDMLRFAGLEFYLSTASLESQDLIELAFHDKSASLRWLDSLIAELEEIRRLVVEGDSERAELIIGDLLEDRQRWLFERQNNDWTEDEGPDLGGMSFTRQLFGFGPKKKDKKK